MKPSPSDRVEIIRLVEDSHLPARRTLENRLLKKSMNEDGENEA
jgi:hypothetical protein